MIPQFKRVVIQGVGLLGASLGMALRRRGIAEQVVGLGRSRKRLERARQLGAIEELTTEAGEALAGADALICCLPVRLIRRRWEAIAPLVEPGALVTDVGSVKAGIVEAGDRVFAGRALFVGSHPMAGGEKAGAETARGDLFEGATCFVTPTAATEPEAISAASRLWKATGARVAIADPARHDRLAAGLSHLPHLAAVATIEALYRGGDSTLLYGGLTGEGLREATRIAMGDAAMWEQIFNENAAAVGEALDGAIDELRGWRALIGASDGQAEIIERLERAARRRAEIGGDGPDGAS